MTKKFKFLLIRISGGVKMCIKKNNFIVICLLALVLLGAKNDICISDQQPKGYYPVPSKGEFCNHPDAGKLPQNPLYKEWCEEMFNNGSLIYEAYRQIAFRIVYTPEPPKVDLWQTPFETISINGGDCEDAILLFHQLLTPHYKGGEIIWGVVHNLTNQTFYPHVWFQLNDIDGNLYIIEPFAGDWNGIIPIEIIAKNEVRQKIIGIPNDIISDIMNSPSKYKNMKDFFIKQVAMHDMRLIKQVDDVLTKLVNVSRRFKRQQHR